MCLSTVFAVYFGNLGGLYFLIWIEKNRRFVYSKPSTETRVGDLVTPRQYPIGACIRLACVHLLTCWWLHLASPDGGYCGQDGTSICMRRPSISHPEAGSQEASTNYESWAPHNPVYDKDWRHAVGIDETFRGSRLPSWLANHEPSWPCRLVTESTTLQSYALDRWGINSFVIKIDLLSHHFGGIFSIYKG